MAQIQNIRATLKPYVNLYGAAITLLIPLQFLAPLLRAAGVGISIPELSATAVMSAIACLLF